MTSVSLLGLIIIAVAVYATVRQADVRLALLLAALALGSLAGDPMAVVRTFLVTLVNEQFVVPICTAMGFAYVLRHTGCDQHLVHLLVRPMERFRPILIPGAVVVGFLINIPVISQTSTAVTLGAVLVPLFRAGGISPVTTGAALLLGSSLGGELLNPGAPELRTVTEALNVESKDCIARIFPLLMLQLVLATAVFWVGSAQAEARYRKEEENRRAGEKKETVAPPPFRVNLVKALVPLVPLAILFATSGPARLVDLRSLGWLADPNSDAEMKRFDSRLIGAAMLVGVMAASLVSWGTAAGSVRAFFEGAGYAYTYIISLIVAASCLGEGVKLIGLADLIGRLMTGWPPLLVPTAAALPMGFAVLSGSGMAATQSLFRLFVEPSQALGVDAMRVGAVVSISAAAGRTMSPVAAVVLMSATLTETRPIDVIRRVAVPLVFGTTAVVIAAAVLG